MLTKKSQLNWNKPDKKGKGFGKRPSRGSFGKNRKTLKKKSAKKLATDDELDYLQYMKDMDFPCFICDKHDRNQNHHLRFDDTDRLHTSSGVRDHTLLVPVCWEHHYGKEASFHGSKYGLAKRYTKEKLISISRKYYEDYLKGKL